MSRKLSQSKRAKEMRKMRREETPEQREARLVIRRAGLARFRACQGYQPNLKANKKHSK